MTSQEKLDIARQLAKLGVDIIEAGFPMASPDDFEAVKQIAETVGNDVQADGYVPVICGLSRTKFPDLERAWNAVKPAKRPRVHTFIATSEIHMKYKLRMTEDQVRVVQGLALIVHGRNPPCGCAMQVVESAVAAVKHLKSLGCNDIEFSPEDAGRSEPRFLYRVSDTSHTSGLKLRECVCAACLPPECLRSERRACACHLQILGEVIKAGATTLNIPDTTGWNLPHEFGGLIADIKKNTPGADSVIISTHCQVCGRRRPTHRIYLPGAITTLSSPSSLSSLSSPRTDRTTSGWRRQTASRVPSTGRGRLRAPSTGSGSGPGTPRSRRWSWPSR